MRCGLCTPPFCLFLNSSLNVDALWLAETSRVEYVIVPARGVYSTTDPSEMWQVLIYRNYSHLLNHCDFKPCEVIHVSRIKCSLSLRTGTFITVLHSIYYSHLYRLFILIWSSLFYRELNFPLNILHARGKSLKSRWLGIIYARANSSRKAHRRSMKGARHSSRLRPALSSQSSLHPSLS